MKKFNWIRASAVAAVALLGAVGAQAGFTVEEDDVKLKFGGRLMSDWSIISEDDETEAALGDQRGGHEFRRARLYVSGKLYDSVIFKVQYDFAGGDADFKDAYIGLTGDCGTVKMGHFKEPFSLEELTSSKYITFLERSLPNAFAPGRNVGVAYGKAFGGEPKEEMGTLTFGLFRQADGYGTTDLDEDTRFTARFTAVPWYEDKDRLFHVGGAFRYSNLSDGTSSRFRARPENHVTSRYVDTGSIADVDSRFEYNIEGALVSGPFSFQTEFIGSSLDASAAGDPSFNSFYLYGSVFLTPDDHRSYKNSAGAFSRVKPADNFTGDGGMGAWELAFRYSRIDLNDSGVTGGELDNFTLGLNWYLNPYTRFMFNYVRSDLDKVGDTNAFLARFQVDF